MAEPNSEPMWDSIAPASLPTGRLASLSIQSDRDDLAELSALAAQLLQDSLRVRQLTERVYQLMQADLRLQRERCGSHGRRH